MRRIAAYFALLALAIFPAGCGSGGTPSSTPAADVVPASAPLYFALNTDFESDQLQQARDLLDRFPDGAAALDMVRAELESDENVDFETDVRPALGDQVGLVFLTFPTGAGDPDVVALVQPEDKAKLDTLVQSGEEPAVTREIGDWTAVANGDAVLDRFEQAQSEQTLDESDDFTEAMDGLPDETLVKAYVNTRALVGAIAAQSPEAPQLQQFLSGEVPSIGAAASAEENGVRLEARTKTTQEAQNFAPELPSTLPSGALAYVGFGDVGSSIRESLNKAGEQNPQLDQGIAQLELGLGISLDDDVLPLFEHEGALAVYPATAGTTDQPGVVLALTVDDATQATGLIDRTLQRASGFQPSIPAPESVTIGSVSAKSVRVNSDTEILYAAVDGTLVVTNQRSLIQGIAEGGTSLADDEVFDRGKDNAGVPDEVGGLVYLNLEAGANYVLSLAESSGEDVPPQVSRNVEPLDSLVFYASTEDDRANVSGFLSLK